MWRGRGLRSYGSTITLCGRDSLTNSGDLGLGLASYKHDERVCVTTSKGKILRLYSNYTGWGAGERGNSSTLRPTRISNGSALRQRWASKSRNLESAKTLQNERHTFVLHNWVVRHRARYFHTCELVAISNTAGVGEGTPSNTPKWVPPTLPFGCDEQ
jgi:hypothetical protein